MPSSKDIVTTNISILFNHHFIVHVQETQRNKHPLRWGAAPPSVGGREAKVYEKDSTAQA